MAPSATHDDPTSKSSRLAIPKNIETRLFINGEFVPSVSGKKFDVVNPATEEVTASVYEADGQDVDKAVAAAKAAFPAWSEMGGAARGKCLFKLADLVEAAHQDLAVLDSVSMGGPVGKYIDGFMGAVALRYFAGKTLDVQGDTSLNTPGMMTLTLRQPYGVCAAIIPWNIPVLAFIMKFAPAMATGNTLVLKTSEKSPLSALHLAKLIQQAGFPPGVINILSGFGRPCGDAIARHMEIRKLGFTGSARTGRAVKIAAAESNLKNVTLELGGKSPLVVFDDADIDRAVPMAANSILFNSGQVCIASSRVYVHAKIADAFTTKMLQAVEQMGHNPDVDNSPLSLGTLRGPQADKLQFAHVMRFLDDVPASGGKVLTGGRRDGSQGYFVQPTIIADAREDSRIVKEEIFGPVVAINTFDDDDEVLRLANDTEFGLYASVFTRDLARAVRFAKGFEAGTVGVNVTSPAMAFEAPFGGWKQSGDGREMSQYSLETWTELKTVLIAT